MGMTGRWINNIWLGENDIMEELCANRDDLRQKILFVERKIEALKYEQYKYFEDFMRT